MPLSADCSEIIPSWDVYTPAKTFVEIQLRVRYGTVWSKAYRMALWDSAPTASKRTSFGDQRDSDGHVATDTLVLRPGADAVIASLVCHEVDGNLPQLNGVTLVCSGSSATSVDNNCCEPCCLETPCFSQYSYADEDGWCSPTALTMVLGYWYECTQDPTLASFRLPDAVPQIVAPRVYDPKYDGYGNWSFNVAFAANMGLDSYVARMQSLAEIEPWVHSGIPVVATIAWREGQLRGAPIPRSFGHLVVVTGFTTKGDVLVADPAGSNRSEVRRCYQRSEFELCWLRPHGTAYLIAPKPHIHNKLGKKGQKVGRVP